MPAFTTVRNVFVVLMITFLVNAFTFISSKSSPYFLIAISFGSQHPPPKLDIYVAFEQVPLFQCFANQLTV